MLDQDAEDYMLWEEDKEEENYREWVNQYFSHWNCDV